ncbi:MAG: energy-coupling factor transporter ATPase [Clostridiales bacterium]
METAVMVNIESLVFEPEAQPALKEISLDVKKGDFVAITGGVASGKSALLHCITGAIPKYHEGDLKGTIKVMGDDVAKIPLPKISSHLGYMMQDPQSQIIDVDVYEDIAFGIGNMEMSLSEMDKKIKTALDYVDLAGFENRKTDALSGGQAQRVVLAGVLAMDAPVLVLDQPTAELDPKGRRELYAHLGNLNKEKNKTIIMVMDRIEEVIDYANRVVIMEKGTIIKECTPQEFSAIAAANVPSVDNAIREYGETVVSIKDAAYTYNGGFVGCLPINLEIAQGEFVTLMGLNGSGKTTLLKMVEGLIFPSAGSIELFGEKMTKKTAMALRKKVGFLFQNPDYQIFADTVFKEVTFSLRLEKLPSDEITQRGEKALKDMGLFEFKDMHPQLLSRGQRQLLALASVLINEPELIIADEPTSGLDENQSHVIMSILRALSHGGKTVLVVGHDVSLAKVYSHRLVAMYQHEIVADFPAETMSSHQESLADIGLLKGVMA